MDANLKFELNDKIIESINTLSKKHLKPDNSFVESFVDERFKKIKEEKEESSEKK